MNISNSKIHVFDYHQTMIDQGKPFYSNLCSENKDEFNQWVRDNIVLFNEVNSYNDVAPTPAAFVEIIDMGVTTVPSLCHYNTKAVALVKPEYECFTGFVFNNEAISYDEFRGVYTHSFNVLDGNIVDFSRRVSPEMVMEEKPNFSHRYVYAGVRIPLEFIKRFEGEPSMNPLIQEWFVHSKSFNLKPDSF